MLGIITAPLKRQKPANFDLQAFGVLLESDGAIREIAF
jgi:hypothetical protein